MRPDEGELRVIRGILQLFGEAFGLKVNYQKSTAKLIRGDEEDGKRVSSILRCRLAAFPIKYLGLQLALRSVSKAEWQPVLDRALNIIPAW
jgi:hypothetical protein